MILKLFIDYSNDIDNIWEYNANNQPKILTVCDDMMSYMLSNKELQQIVTELFIRGRKLNIFFVFIRQSYFAVQKHVRLKSTQYFIMKIPNKQTRLSALLTLRTL